MPNKGRPRGKKEKLSKSQLKQLKANGKTQRAKNETIQPSNINIESQNTSKSYSKDVHIPNYTMPRPGGGKELLVSTDIQFTQARRYGLVGRNGHGKTTLLTNISTTLIPGLYKHLRILHVKQEMDGTNLSVIDTVLKSDTERNFLKQEEAKILALQNSEHKKSEEYSKRLLQIYERLEYIEASSAPSRASYVLAGLQFTEKMQHMSTKDLSGGWRMRVSLACALFIEPDILLLDEPTNHLDFPAVEQLTDYLIGYSKTLIVVSHDRKFLNDVCTDIIHIEDQKLKYYKGDYDTFERVRIEHRKQAKTAYDKQRATIEHNEDFIRRFRANKKLASLAQSRIRLIAGMEKLEDVKEEHFFKFNFPFPGPLKKNVLISFDDMSFGYYGESKKTFLYENVNLKLFSGTTVGVLGANGAGKSTLVNLVMQKIDPTFGKMVINNSANIGFFPQHHMDLLDPELNSIEFLKMKFPEAKIQEIFQQLGSFNLPQSSMKQKIKYLSGGEKSRVSFAVLTQHHPHLIIMDEPTNHLDLDTIDSLINAIQNFKDGAFILISHDQHFLSSVCNEYQAIGPDKNIKAFSTFSEGKKFSYQKKSIPLSNIENITKKIEENYINDSIDINSDHKPEIHCDIKPKTKKRSKAIFQIEEDVSHLVYKAIKQNKPPIKIYQFIKNLKPDPNTTLVAKAISDYLFTNYFLNTPKDEVLTTNEIEEQKLLLNHMIPFDHVDNQVIMIYSAQSNQNICYDDNKKRARETGAFLTLIKHLYELGICSKEALLKQKEDSFENKVRGKSEALKQSSEFIESLL